MLIKVGDKESYVPDDATVIVYSNKYLIAGKDDIYDLGFSHEEIDKHGIEILYDKTTIILRRDELSNRTFSR